MECGKSKYSVHVEYEIASVCIGCVTGNVELGKSEHSLHLGYGIGYVCIGCITDRGRVRVK